MDRIGIHEYFMNIAQLVSRRSTCLRRSYGAVIVKDRQILATGYNGAPKGVKHCDETGCIRKEKNVPHGQRYELCRSTHAEQNAIAQAAYSGVSIKNSTLYVTGTPCMMCCKIIINAGITKVVYIDDAGFKMTKDMFGQADVEMIKFDEVTI